MQIMILEYDGAIFSDIKVENDVWNPTIDEDYTCENARKEAKEILAELNDTKALLKRILPQRSIGRTKLALEIFLADTDSSLSEKRRKEIIRGLRG